MELETRSPSNMEEKERERVIDASAKADELAKAASKVSQALGKASSGEVKIEEAKQQAYDWIDQYKTFAKQRPGGSSIVKYAGPLAAEKIIETTDLFYKNILETFVNTQRSLESKRSR